MKPTASQRMPERARLASAIERHRGAAEQLARVEAAIQKLYDDSIASRTKIAAARDALHIARHGQSEILISKALGEPAPDLPDPAEAERVLSECERQLEDGREARKHLEAEAQRARSSAGLAKDAVDRAVGDVVAIDPALVRLRAEYARTMASAARLWRSLRSAGVLGVNNIVTRLDGDDPAWIDALAALRENPDAPLPGLPPEEPLDDARAGGHKRAAA